MYCKLRFSVTDFFNKLKHNGLYTFSATVLLLGLSLFMFPGCDLNSEKKNSDSVTDTGWQKDEYFFRSSKILLNSTVSSGSFYVAGLFIFSRFDDDSLESTYNITAGGNSALTYKPALYDHYVMYRGDGDIFTLKSGKYSAFGGSPFCHGIKLHELDSSYSENNTAGVTWYQDVIGSFNNQLQFLAFIDDSSFCLIDINPTFAPSGLNDEEYISIAPSLIRIPYPSGCSLRYIGSYKDKFFAFVDSSFMTINKSGVIRQIPEVDGMVVETFSYKEKLYAVTLFPEQIYVSIDEGETWTLFASDFIYPTTRFFTIQDKLCFYIGSQIAQLDIEKGVITELDNSVLDGNEITSVNEFKGRVWVTTLSGLFYKDTANFFIPKDEEAVETSGTKGFSNIIIIH